MDDEKAPNSGEGEQQPQTPAPPQGPVDETVEVECGNPNCDGVFPFPIKSNTESFAFTCNKCGSHNQWKRD